MVYSMDSSCCGRGLGNRKRRNAAEAEVHHWVFVSMILLQCLFLFANVSVSVIDFANAETSTSSSSSSKRRNLIVNGDTVNPSDYQFFLRSWPDHVRDTTDILCGASLIHSDIILTAAHCQGGFNYGAMAYDPSTGLVNRYKTFDLQISFPDYYSNLDIINYDLMILRLSKPITDIKPVMINADPDFPINSNSSLLDALGFGLTEDGSVSQVLKVGHFTPITNDQCFQRFRIANVDLSEDILCVDPSTDDSICAGDSGGPLTTSIIDSNNNINTVQVGVVSFGNECEPDWIPDGFARVSYFTDWINKQICNYSRDPPDDCFDYYQSEEYNTFITEHGEKAAIPFDKAKISLEFHHDFLAEQTVFSIRNLLSNKIEYAGPQYVPKRGGKFTSTFLLSVPGNYAIEVYDTGMDGLKNPDYVNANYPQGSWILSAEYSNGGRLEELATGDADFEAFQTRQIRLPETVPPLITDPPSFSPTDSPTESSNPSVALSHVVPSLEPTTEGRKNATDLATGRIDDRNATKDNEIAYPTSTSSPLTSCHFIWDMVVLFLPLVLAIVW